MAIATKPKTCESCPLFEIGTGFTKIEGTGSLGIMVIAEASGEAEARDSLPLRPFAQSGSVFEKACQRASINRQQLAVTNIIRCFVSHRTSVFTPGGYKEIRTLTPGDEVLTHKARFRAVEELIKNEGSFDCLQIGYATSGCYVTTPVVSFVTTEHRFYTSKGWQHAVDLQLGDTVIALGEYCTECQTPFVRHFRNRKSLPFCTITCHNKFVARKGADTVRQVMLAAYKDGSRDRFKITEAANKATRVLFEAGYKIPRTPENIARQRLNSALTRQAIGLTREVNWIGFGERDLAAVLEAAGHEYIPQFALEGYNYDFKVGNTIIEVDGANSRLDGKAKRRQPLKDQVALENGFNVVHIRDTDVDNVLNYLDNDNHEFPMLEVPICEVGPVKKKKVVWTLTVEEDESYVAQGWVNHNCRPPNNKLEGMEYEVEAINHCSQYLDAAVKKFKPRAILALGGVATRTLTGLTGPKLGVSNIRGMILHSSRYDLPVVASLHPSYIRRMGMRLTEVLTYDLSLAKQVAEGRKSLESIDKVVYETDPPPEFLKMLLQDWEANTHPIAFDIETAYSIKEMDESGIELASDAITQIQFSDRAGWAVVLPWNKETKEFATKVLALPNDKYSWNGVLFDQRVLAKNGIHIAGRHIDGMDVWHVLQPDLPRGLQFVTSFYAPELGPWKHLSGSQMDFYGGRDVDSLMRIVPRMLADLEKRGVSRGYWEHCQRLRPILDRMCERGLPIDVEGQEALRTQLEQEMKVLFEEIQTVVPRELLKYKKTSGGRDYYKSVPPELKQLNKDGQLDEKTAAEFGYSLLAREEGLYWGKLEGFNPNSSDQMKDYARLKGYKIPLAERANGEESETANDKTVLEWAQKHDDPMCKKVVEYKKRQKIISTYIDGFRPGEDGRVHSEFGFGPATGQLASHNPSILNYPKHGELAKAVRNLIKAADGKILIEFDMKAFHAKTLGWLAKSPAYMRLSDLDIHSYVAAHFIKGVLEQERKPRSLGMSQLAAEEMEKDIEGLDGWLKLPDEELSIRLANIKRKYKSIRDEKAKRAILGIGFGMGASKLYKMNKEAFGSTAEANSIILLVRRLFPEVFEWQAATKDRAHRQSFLLSMHGSIRRFFEVKRWDPQDRRWKGGENAEETLAFLPANSAFGEIKDRIIEMEDRGLLERYGLVNSIHDSVVFECPLELVDECIPTIKAILERPSTILVDSVMGAFQCSADVQMGERWGELKEIKVG